jgi:hypothetical protein
VGKQALQMLLRIPCTIIIIVVVVVVVVVISVTWMAQQEAGVA